jgi:putative transposase
MTKLRHYDELGTARFVTFSCYRRRPILSLPGAYQALVSHLDTWRTEQQTKLLGYVFMPDHVHLVVLPPESLRLGPAIGQLKGRFARDLGRIVPGGIIPRRPNGGAAVWERRFYDHNCRTPQDTLQKINYCHNNPVAGRLVGDPRDWPWSSYGWFHGAEDAVLSMDVQKLEDVEAM